MSASAVPNDPISRRLDFIADRFQDRENYSLKRVELTHDGYLVVQYNNLPFLLLFNIYDNNIRSINVGKEETDDNNVELTNVTIKFPFVTFIKINRSSANRTYFIQS